jgi:addiction module HigA family antidote
MLAEEFLKPLGMSNYRLAKEIRVPAQRIGAIIAGRRTITADTDLRLCRFFGLSEGWWLRLQADHDTRIAKAELAKELELIKPLEQLFVQEPTPGAANPAVRRFIGSDKSPGSVAEDTKRLLREHFRGKRK